MTNTGNVTLTNVTLADTVGGVTISGGPIASLAPGRSTPRRSPAPTRSPSPTSTPGSVHNLATATGTRPGGSTVSDHDDETVTLPQAAAIDLVKTGTFEDESGDGNADVGETISYAFRVDNTGNVTLTNVTLADTVGGVTISGGPIASLAPGAGRHHDVHRHLHGHPARHRRRVRS